ncbi:PD40 domain-containing protein, partial [candidate division KSB1 bacterium]|nr:PD40 domain-containing protein [candidate division KSB1 bacterium]
MERLTNNPASEGYPTISPNGSTIAFDSNRNGNFDIYIMNIDGTDQIRLTDNPANDVSASWSPDGKKLAYMSYINGAFAIRLMNADGSD